jgi:hypothetical protein
VPAKSDSVTSATRSNPERAEVTANPVFTALGCAYRSKVVGSLSISHIVGPGKLGSCLELLIQRETEGRGAQNDF